MGFDRETVEEYVKEVLENAKEDIVEDFMARVCDHMNEQPYKTMCNECGEDLDIHLDKIDNDNDLYVYVDPCQRCLKEAQENG